MYEQLHPMFHVSLLEEYVTKKGQEPHLYASGELPELADDDEEQEWEVEAIVDHRQEGRGKKLKYLIKWKSWPDDHNTWLPAYPNLANAKELLQSYNKNYSLSLQSSSQPPAKVLKSLNTSRQRGRPSKEKRRPSRPHKVRDFS